MLPAGHPLPMPSCPDVINLTLPPHPSSCHAPPILVSYPDPHSTSWSGYKTTPIPPLLYPPSSPPLTATLHPPFSTTAPLLTLFPSPPITAARPTPAVQNRETDTVTSALENWTAQGRHAGLGKPVCRSCLDLGQVLPHSLDKNMQGHYTLPILLTL